MQTGENWKGDGEKDEKEKESDRLRNTVGTRWSCQVQKNHQSSDNCQGRQEVTLRGSVKFKQ